MCSSTRSEEHTSELQSQFHLVCRLLLEKKNKPRDREDPPLAPRNNRKDTRHRPQVPRIRVVVGAAIAYAPRILYRRLLLFFFNDTATTEIYTLSLHDALPISRPARDRAPAASTPAWASPRRAARSEEHTSELQSQFHLVCRLLLEKKKQTPLPTTLHKKKKKNKNS